jgi:CBS domain-containing protein
MMPVVRDFMTTNLVYVNDGTRPRLALHPILELGITVVPVLDAEHRPVGVISLRDIVENPTATEAANSPVIEIPVDASIDAAARRLADSHVHHLVVVDGDGRAVGMLSSLDVVRAFLHMRSDDGI